MITQPAGRKFLVTTILLALTTVAHSALAEDVAGKLSKLGQTKTTLFGIEATGSSFLYVFDRSGSMSVPDGKPLKAAKEELLRSLDTLNEVQQFQIIFYNETPSMFAPTRQRGGLIFGRENNRDEAKAFVEGVKASGGTKHVDALIMAVKLKPDAIFLLTDGDDHDDMTDEEIERVVKLNTGGSRIYVIQCSPADQNQGNHLVKLAEQTAGKHVYREITKPAEKKEPAKKE